MATAPIKNTTSKKTVAAPKAKPTAKATAKTTAKAPAKAKPVAKAPAKIAASTAKTSVVPAQLASKAKDYREQAEGKARQFADQASDLAAQAGDRAKGLAKDGKDRMADGLSSFAKMIEDSASTVDDKIGKQYGDVARTAAKALAGFATTVDQKDIDELATNTRDFVKKSPAIAIGTAAVIGFVLARMLKSSSSDDA